MKRAPSQLIARVRDSVGRVASSAAVLLGLYVLTLLLLMNAGCAAPAKQPSDDVISGKAAVGDAKTLMNGAKADLENAKESLK